MNHVLHIAAIVQLLGQTPGRAYYDRKVAAGKTPNEAMRCLIGEVSACGPARVPGRGSPVASKDGLVAAPL